jgi:hypothetical protein
VLQIVAQVKETYIHVFGGESWKKLQACKA